MGRECITKALIILEGAGIDVQTVTEWADKMGYSRAHFSRIFVREFGITAKDYLRNFKLQVITQAINKTPQATGYEIAKNAGFIDEKALHKYLKFHCNSTLTRYKSQNIKKSQIRYK